VLPDRWRFAFDEEDQGNEKHYEAVNFDDSKWPAVATFSTTLDSQGYDKNTVLWYRTKLNVPAKHGKLALFFGEVDGASEVYVNGQKIEVLPPPAARKPATGGEVAATTPARTGQARPRTPFEVEVTGAVHAGENVIALRVDHTKITDLSLGGILRPVLLIQKPE
jgi:beta-galactosidase/beta-glucuronidase